MRKYEVEPTFVLRMVYKQLVLSLGFFNKVIHKVQNNLIIGVFTLCLISGMAWAEGGSIKILVTDELNNTPIANATVFIVGKRSITDSMGQVSIKNILAGKYDVLCTAASYEHLVVKQVEVNNGSDVEVNCGLKKVATNNKQPKYEEQNSVVEAKPKPKIKPLFDRKLQFRQEQGVSSGIIRNMSARMRAQNFGFNDPVVSGQRVHNTEEYDKIDDAPFKPALQEPLSTFSIDVDTA